MNNQKRFPEEFKIAAVKQVTDKVTTARPANSSSRRSFRVHASLWFPRCWRSRGRQRSPTVRRSCGALTVAFASLDWQVTLLCA